VLYADDYDFHHGFVAYRGHFTATGTETGITVTADGIAPTGAFAVWFNGTFLGTGGNKTAQAFTFPPNTLRAGADNVIAVLVEDTGHQEGPIAEPTGLYTATLTGSTGPITAPITWRLSGNTDGPGPTPGADLPTNPQWSPITLPDTWASRGTAPGIGWYRTSVTLHLPRDSYVPVAVRIAADRPATANYRASIYVNGWLIGRYVNNVGPQTDFYVPAGILDDDGTNAIAIQVWGLDRPGGGLGTVSLVAQGNQAVR